MIPRLKEKYNSELKLNLLESLSLKNINQVPTLEKIIINIGDGKAATDGRALESMIDEITAISGQKPVIRRAKKSIAGFKLREGMPIGVSVTLRGDRMWEFYDRFVQVVVPRIRDFRGFSKKSFDGNGNYSLGLNEQLVFPEVEYDKVRDIRGMNITICTSANDNNQGYVLLQTLGFPFREN
ncbi:MAG: 50S ribosomal protein L5 [Candidatus Actinomarina sp.]